MVYVVPAASGTAGVHVTRLPSTSRVPPTSALPPAEIMNVEGVTELGRIGSEKVAPMVPVRETFVARLAGEVDRTVGAVLSPVGPSSSQAASPGSVASASSPSVRAK